MAQTTADATVAGDHGAADLERIYRSLRLIRRVEEEIARIYPTDRIKSPVHLSIGQEAVSVGICDVLRPDDVIAPTYRGHAAYLAKGGSLAGMMAELYGKSTGVAGGKGGSMHLVDMSRNVLGASAVVGTTIPVALGYAFALKSMKTDRIVVSFFGDGATEEGVFAESLNFAALRKLPILFVCENNFYAIHAPIKSRWASDKLCERVETYDIPAYRCDDGDVLRLRSLTAEVVRRLRDGAGPAFIECRTCRWCEHVGPTSDFRAGYRSSAEMEPWLHDDQVKRLAARVAPEERTKIDADIEQNIAEALRFAEASPFPTTEALYANVYAGA